MGLVFPRVALSSAALVVWSAAPRSAFADPPPHARHLGLELQGIVTRELVPTSFLGLDGAFSIGNGTFDLRLGGAVLGAPSFQLAANDVRNLLSYAQADVCAGKASREHRIRMCVGAEAGGWVHRWSGYGEPGRRLSAHVAGSLKADYQFAFTDRMALLVGVGVSVPGVGPQFRGRDQFGRPTPIVVPGPVAGSLRVGTKVRFGPPPAPNPRKKP